MADSEAGHAAPDEEELRSWLPWCRSLPKIELHAHLNGSIRSSTLLELAAELSRKGVIVFSDVKDIILKDDRSLSECFKLFDLIHILTTDHGTISRITKEVVEDFAAENVVYLELRTTPKCNLSVGMTKRSYVEAVLTGLKAVEGVQVIGGPIFQAERPDNPRDLGFKIEEDRKKRDIYVKLLLSIDRRESTEAAMDTVQLAMEMQKFGVVGVDLSGNPRVGDWQTFVPALTWAKKQGLPVTLHCGEISNPTEVQSMLAFQPERLGHVCCLEDSEWTALLSSSIPVEVCLTSNVRTECVPLIWDHHFVMLHKSGHPLSICTDDPGIFGTDISREYALAAVCFGLTKSNLFSLANGAIKYIFAGDDIKLVLQSIFDVAKKCLK